MTTCEKTARLIQRRNENSTSDPAEHYDGAGLPTGASVVSNVIAMQDSVRVSSPRDAAEARPYPFYTQKATGPHTLYQVQTLSLGLCTAPDLSPRLPYPEIRQGPVSELLDLKSQLRKW